MRRSSVLVGGALALLTAPKPPVGQQPEAKIPRVGVLTQASSDRAPMFDAFKVGLRDLGYVEGRNIILEFRFAGAILRKGGGWQPNWWLYRSMSSWQKGSHRTLRPRPDEFRS